MQGHNHEASNCAATDLRNNLKRTAADEVGSTNKIFWWVTRHHLHGVDVSFPTVERSMFWAKRCTQLRQPYTAEEYASILESPEDKAFNRNLRAVIRDYGSGHLAMIFNCLTLAALITIFDSTFYTMPALFYQLFKLPGFYKGHSFPLIFILTSVTKFVWSHNAEGEGTHPQSESWTSNVWFWKQFW